MTANRFPAITMLTALAACAPSAVGQYRTIKARVAAFDQVITYNRIGTQQLSGMMYALLRDIVPTQSSGLPTNISCAEQQCRPGYVQLRASKRPRPIVLRMNVGDTLEVEFTNLLNPSSATPPNGDRKSVV